MRAVRYGRVSRGTRRVALVAGMLLVVGATAAAPAQAQEDALLVGVESRFCPRPQFATIAEAVVAAPAGATVQVCPGTYRDTVVVDKSLTLLGAQHGIDARTGRPNPRTESIVTANGGGFVILGGVSEVTIDGFTVQSPASETPPADGIKASGGGFTIVNNVIIGTGHGILLRATAPSTVVGNHLWSNAAGIVSSGPAAVTISDNVVEGSAGTGILLAVDTAGSTVSGSVVTGSGSADCRDDSLGDATAGTANTWTGNTGPLSSPAGLCAPS